MLTSADKTRIDWVDYAKGICILLVVAFHSISGVERVTGTSAWTHHLIAFATPFRMPDFFVISGLFLSRVIDRNWRNYADKKVLHFAYFYFLWLAIIFVFKAPNFIAQYGAEGTLELFLISFIDPFGSMWFIYLLPVFFLVTKLARDIGIPASAMLLLGVVLEALPVHTGWVVLDEFAARFVYFFAGYWFAGHFFALASWVQQNTSRTIILLCVWAPANGVVVYSGYGALPGISLVLGFAGAAAVVAIAAMIAKTDIANFLRYMGANSIVIYLAFFLPMALTRTVLLKLDVVGEPGLLSIIVVANAVIIPLLMQRLARGTNWKYLFQRPDWAKLKPRSSASVVVPAE